MSGLTLAMGVRGLIDRVHGRGERTVPPTLLVTGYERRVMAARRRDLLTWALIGGIAAPIVYAWVTGWPPPHPLPFVVGLGLVLLWLALVPVARTCAVRSHKLGPASGVSGSALLLRTLTLAVQVLIAGALLVQFGDLSWRLVIAVALLVVCGDPIRRYVDHVTLHQIRTSVEKKGGTVQGAS